MGYTSGLSIGLKIQPPKWRWDIFYYWLFQLFCPKFAVYLPQNFKSYWNLYEKFVVISKIHFTCFSIDRYDAITHPMNFSGSWKRARGLVAAAWILSFIFSAPLLHFFDTKDTKDYGTQCSIGTGWKQVNKSINFYQPRSGRSSEAFSCSCSSWEAVFPIFVFYLLGKTVFQCFYCYFFSSGYHSLFG